MPIPHWQRLTVLRLFLVWGTHTTKQRHKAVLLSNDAPRKVKE